MKNTSQDCKLGIVRLVLILLVSECFILLLVTRQSGEGFLLFFNFQIQSENDCQFIQIIHDLTVKDLLAYYLHRISS